MTTLVNSVGKIIRSAVRLLHLSFGNHGCFFMTLSKGGLLDNFLDSHFQVGHLATIWMHGSGTLWWFCISGPFRQISKLEWIVFGLSELSETCSAAEILSLIRKEEWVFCSGLLLLLLTSFTIIRRFPNIHSPLAVFVFLFG